MNQFKRSLAIAEKNIRIYYYKGPVIIFGVLIPLFLFLSFYIGRKIPIKALIPGLLGMTTFFTSTSVGPAIVPWEARAKTLERLISSPVSIWTIFLGDVISSFLFGILVSTIPVFVGLLLGVKVLNPFTLIFGVVLAAFCFASFSVLLSSYPPSNVPASSMMLSSLVKFPLIFVSGVFIPIKNLPLIGKIVSSVSPLTYFTELARYSLQGSCFFPVEIDFLALMFFNVLFFVAAVKIHERTLPQRL